MKNLFSKLLCVSLLSFSLVASAQDVTTAAPEPKPTVEPVVQTSTPAKTETSIEALELLFEIEALDRLSSLVGDQLGKWQPLDDVVKSAEDLAARQTVLAEKLKQHKRLSSWNLKRALDFKDLCSDLFKESEKFKKKYTDFITQSEATLTELKAKDDFFRGQATTLPDEAALANQDEIIGQAVARVGALISQVKRARLNYTSLYQANLTLLTNITALSNTLTKEIEKFKTERFKKNGKALYQKEFYNKVTKDELRRELSVENIFSDTSWQQLTRPPVYVVTLCWLVLTVTFMVFFAKRIQNEAERGDISALLIVFAALKIIDALSVPLALYRLFLFGACLVMTFFALQRAKKHATQHFLYYHMARLLAVLFFGAALTEFLGYHLLAVTILGGAVKTLVLFFVVGKLRVYFGGILPVLMQNTRLTRYQVFSLSQKALQNQVRVLFYLLLGSLTLVSLTMIWGTYENISEASLAVLGAGLHYTDHSITVGMIGQAVVATVIILSLSTFACRVLETKVYPANQISIGTGKSIGSLMQYATWLVVVMFVFSILGFEFKQLAIIFGALSVGIGFGLQHIVNNMVSGLILLFERPIRVGDLLEINNQWGWVEKVGLRSTIIRSDHKAQIIIPNSEFVTQRVVNLTFSEQDHRFSIAVGVAYGSDTALVQQIIIETALAHPLIMKDPAPKVYLLSFGEFSLNFELWATTSDVEKKKAIVSDLNLALEKKFKEKGIEIPFPRRDVHIKSL